MIHVRSLSRVADRAAESLLQIRRLQRATTALMHAIYRTYYYRHYVSTIKETSRKKREEDIMWEHVLCSTRAKIVAPRWAVQHSKSSASYSFNIYGHVHI